MSYSDLINVDDFEKRDDFVEDRGEVSFYCKDCKKEVQTSRPNKDGYKFICNICNGSNIAIGTKEGIKSNYKL